jgi:heat shock protein HspQ
LRATPSAKFTPGQLIHHRLFGYRGVVFDVDAEFSGTDDWYEQVARSRPPRDEPWYHVLPDGVDHTTYVAERNLEADTDGSAIRHPLVSELFGRLGENGYELETRLN